MASLTKSVHFSSHKSTFLRSRPFGGFHPRRLRIDRLLQNLIDRALNKHRSIIMQNDGPPEINFIDLTADIVSAHVSNNSVAISDLPMLIQKVHERSEEHTSELQSL